jgi:peptidoglycan-associated lipoprotein
MRGSTLVGIIGVVGVLGAGAGCSHEQQADKSAARPAAPPRTVVIAGPPKPAPPPTVVTDTPKQKEGDDAIFFDFDSALVRDDARPVLQKVADRLHRRPASLRIEGNCDEVGTVEYNLALGEQRARAAKEYLVHLGVPSEKIATVSYGAQRPKDPGHDDTSHAQNRRDDLLIR